MDRRVLEEFDRQDNPQVRFDSMVSLYRKRLRWRHPPLSKREHER